MTWHRAVAVEVACKGKGRGRGRQWQGQGAVAVAMAAAAAETRAGHVHGRGKEQGHGQGLWQGPGPGPGQGRGLWQGQWPGQGQGRGRGWGSRGGGLPNRSAIATVSFGGSPCVHPPRLSQPLCSTSLRRCGPTLATAKAAPSIPVSPLSPIFTVALPFPASLQPLSHAFYRAATDNDQGGADIFAAPALRPLLRLLVPSTVSYAHDWRRLGLPTCTSVEVVAAKWLSPTSWRVRTRHAPAVRPSRTLFYITTTYTFAPDAMQVLPQ